MGSGVSGLYNGASVIRPFPGSADFTEKGDQYSENIRKRKDVDVNGAYDVIAHGRPDFIKVDYNGISVKINHRVASKLIKHDKYYPGKSIRLLSCDTGSSKTGFAQNLANKLNVVVEAPTSWVWAYPNGRYFVAAPNKYGRPDLSKRGRFVKFYPGGNKK